MLTENETLNIMHSDFAVWSTAEKKDVGPGAVELTLVLPWNIGRRSVTLEGLTNAEAKRNAIGTYGDLVRGWIDERISDEAVESRAVQAAAKAEQVDSSDSVEERGRILTDASPEAQADSGPTTAYHEHADGDGGLRETLTARRIEVAAELQRADEIFDRCTRELAMIDAALEVE